MRAPGSTVVILVGDEVDAALRGLGRLPNVTVRMRKGSEAEARAPEAATASAQTPYLVHDLDPLARIAKSWVAYFDEPEGLSELDVEVELALAALEKGDSLMPDYYLVLGPETMAPTLRHWWLGAVGAIAPTRVLPCPPTAAAVEHLLPRLPTGRSWPPPRDWLRELKTKVPDRVGLL